MATPSPAGILRYIRHLVRADGGGEHSDGQLLGRFVTRRDEAAFAALLARHGPLVLGVCRQVLRNPHDAEDAFQATFLVLARKAAAIHRYESLAAWLYRVALNIARSARTSTARRRAHEREAALMPHPVRADDGLSPEWQPLLHEEVNRLPAKYRVPVVLCYLEGKTHDETAQQLGWPLGTVKGRLARARDLLRGRLVRRGVTLLPAGLGLLSRGAAEAAVPDALAASTARAALAGGGSAPVVTLVEGVLRAMFLTRVKMVVLVGLAVAALGSGGMLAYRAFATGRPGDLPVALGATIPDLAPTEGQAVRPAGAADDFGPEVKGLRAKVSLAEEQFEAGEAVPVKYVVKNVSKEEQTLWHSGFWPNHLIAVKDADGKEAPLTDFGRQCRKAFAPGGDRWKNVSVKVPPGGQDAAYEPYDLTKLFDLSRPGRYTVQYVYEEKQGGWGGRLPSNQAAFQVIAKAEGEQKVKKRAESKPADVQGLRFVALVPERVSPPPAGGACDFDLGLRVVNVSDKPVALATFDVIRPRLYFVSGKRVVELGMDSRRKDTPRLTPPAMLAPGASWKWRPEARLSWTTDRSALQLSGPDGRGIAGSWSFVTLKEGRYRLVIEYANSNPKLGDVALWVGKATTNAAEFEIAPPK
jgi:RNA polymerase sigma factor (sigma-70 family)